MDSKIEWPKNKVDRVLNSMQPFSKKYRLWWRDRGKDLDLTIVGFKGKKVESLEFYGLTATQKQEIEDCLEAKKLIEM